MRFSTLLKYLQKLFLIAQRLTLSIQKLVFFHFTHPFEKNVIKVIKLILFDYWKCFHDRFGELCVYTTDAQVQPKAHHIPHLNNKFDGNAE